MSTNAFLDRVPPQNIDAERSTIGSMLLDKDAIFRAIEILKPEDFYKDAHRIIFQAVTNLTAKNEPVDLVTVTEELRTKNILDAVGGIAYLTGLANAVPTAANVEYYAKIVEEKALMRNLIHAATEIVSSGYEGSEEVDKIMDAAEQSIFDVAQRRATRGYAPLKEILNTAFENIEKMYENKGGVTGINTGYNDLNRLTAGLQPSDLIILAARPSMGKTTFVLNIAQHVAVVEKQPVAVFSLEMSKEQLAMKLLCSEAGVDNQRIRTGNLAETDWPLLSRA
ncbi:MAG TPA: replicative DNA helicase, partial [Bacillota bacterium]|nr:replicative DNA helicase [Bacillota bacterium]